MAYPRPSPLFIHLFMALFLLSAGLGIVPSYDRNLSLPTLEAVVIGIVLYFLIAIGGRGWRLTYFFAGLALVVVSVAALLFILQFDRFSYPDTPGFIARIGRILTRLPYLGLYPQPNAAGMVMAAFIPLAVAFALPTQAYLSKAIWTVFGLALLLGLVLTFSRGAMAALGVVTVIAIMIVIAKRLEIPLWILVGAALIVIALGIGVIALVGPGRIPVLGSTFAAAFDRFTLYRNSFYVGSDYAITGAGLGDTFAMIYSRYGLLIQVPFLTYPHNLPLAVWFNQGLLGIAALLGFIISFYSYVFGVISAAQPPRVFHAGWLGVTVILLHGLTDAPQYSNQLWAMPALFILAGLTAAAGQASLADAEFEDGVEFVSAWRGRLIAVAVVVLLLAAGGGIFNRQIQTMWLSNQGAVDETHGELAPGLDQSGRNLLYDSAENRYRQALTINPNYSNANRRLGNLLVNRGRYQEAVPFLEAAYAAEPINPAAVKGLGLAYVWMGQTEEAARLFLQLPDPSGMAGELNTWGSYRQGINQTLLAARAWETAALIASEEEPNLNVWGLIAVTYRDAGDVEKAREWYGRILDVDPENADALAGMESIQQS
jgi:tetratricopeptide (TPR) repeat protein